MLIESRPGAHEVTCLRTRERSILPINVALILVGLADLVTTLLWLRCGLAVEVNPLMASALKAGVPLFAFVKVATLCAYVGVMEWYRRRYDPNFARAVGNVTVTAYVGIYAVCFAIVNHGLLVG